MRKQAFISVLAILLAGTGALAYFDSPSTPDAYTGATPEVAVSGNVLGNASVSAKQLAGVWGDASGIAAYGTKELLEQAGGKQATDAIGNGIDDVMSRMGVREVVVEFAEDGTMSASSPSGKVEGIYTVDGSVITITVDGTEFAINANVSGKRLRLFYPVARMPQQILQYFTSHSTEGLYLGVELKRQ